MAEVFRAIHRQSRRTVAIKRILPSVAEDEEFISMFRDEATIASQLDHPNIAKIFDIGRIDTAYYIALEFVSGRDMRTILDNAERRDVQLPLDLILHVMLSLCKGLDYAHRRKDVNGVPMGLVHRDVSPQNVLVSFDGDVKLIDFGIAKAAGKLARTQVGSIKGKFGYMSPEQVRGLPVDQRSDIFSLGICLWEFLTKQRLFHGDNEIVVMERIRNAEVDPPSHIVPTLSPELDQMVMRALAKDADERYTSASDFHADLSAYAHTVGMVVQRDLVADYMRRTFPNGASHRAVSREEAHAMADNKGGSDLDVFEGLARKPQARPATTPPTAPSSQAVPSPSGAPPPPPGRARTLLGMAPPMPPSARPPVPSSPGRLPMPSTPGLPPPPTARGSGVLPAVSPPPAKSSAPPPGRGPMPSNPLPPPTAPPAKAGSLPGPAPAKPAAVDMDWDDEDEKTHVYDKQSTDEVAEAIMQPLPAAGTPAPPPTSAAAALLQRSGNVAPPMPKVPSIPPPGHVVPGPPPRSVQAAEPTMLSAPKDEQRKSSSLPWVIVALLAVVLLVGGAAFFLVPSTGELRVYVSGPQGRDIGKVDIFVNNNKVCTSSPCTVTDLKAGIHDVKAEAEGYEATAPRGVEIKSRSQAKLDLELAVASAGTGFKVAGAQQGIKLFVDGAEVGPLPQTIKNLSPGEHKLRFVGSDRYEPLEKTITVVPDKIEDLGDIKLGVVKGKATLELVTRGARILLVPSKGEKRQIDERMFKNDQLSIDIDTSKEWSIEATKPGHDDLKLPISFADGQAEKTFRIELAERGKAPAGDDRDPTRPPATAPTSPGPGPGPGPTAPATVAAPTGGPAKLNINSIPPSAVLLDGRPLGRTPKAGVVVSPGTHTITFIHPEKGRKSTSVTVKAGETKGVGVRF
jgi:serine/threonine-protein kinase